jgi:hypothetical protein
MIALAAGESASLKSDLQIVMRPLIEAYGANCGPSLVAKVGTGIPHVDLSVDYRGGTPNSASLLALGGHRVSIPLPGGCQLLTAPFLVVPFATDSTGSASWRATFLPGQVPAVHLQAADMEDGIARL